MFKKIAVIAAVLAVFLSILFLTLMKKDGGPVSEIIIVHNTPESMSVWLKAGGVTHEVKLGGGRGSYTFLLHFREPSAYDIRVQYASGRVLQKTLGHVRPETVQKDRIEITDYDIKLLQDPAQAS